MKTLIAIAVLCCAVQEQREMPKPGKEHAALKQLEGEWEAHGKFVMDPSQPPCEMTGTETAKVGYGGFWLTTEFRGTMLGNPIEGRWTMTYSPIKKKYVATWIDSMMPFLFTAEGELDATGKIYTFVADSFDPASGKLIKERWVMETKDADNHTMTFYSPEKDGKERKSGEIVYKRKK
jgi:hypothetical protein